MALLGWATVCGGRVGETRINDKKIEAILTMTALLRGFALMNRRRTGLACIPWRKNACFGRQAMRCDSHSLRESNALKTRSAKILRGLVSAAAGRWAG